MKQGIRFCFEVQKCLQEGNQPKIGESNRMGKYCSSVCTEVGLAILSNRQQAPVPGPHVTVFIFVSGTWTDLKINVSELYYIGETNYLRAWVYVDPLGCNQEDTFKIPGRGEVLGRDESSETRPTAIT